MKTARLVITAVLVLGAHAAFAQDKPSITVPRVDTPPALADYLDGKAVPPGLKVSGFKQREPGDGVDAGVETDVYVSYDDKHFYAVFICRDDPAKIRANLTKREAILGDDVVGLFLDTYGDGRRFYMFLTNPLGIQMDGVAAEGQDDDYSFDTLWASEGRRTAYGFAVVMAVPFKSLRFSTEMRQSWGIAFGRMVPRTNETAFWPYITRRISSTGKQLARLEGLEGISPGRNLLFIPYGNFAADRVLEPDGYVSDKAARVGLDMKAVIKDTVTVDGTVNPDFSQVESDEPQVTINQRFEVFFPEKRPFFIENAGYFESPVNLFHSRRIADPKFGGRVTGKAAGWAFGGLVTNDDAPGERADADDPRSGSTAFVTVLRAQRDFANQSYVGGLFTDREWGTTANRVYSADGRWRIDDNWSVTGQAVGSQSVQLEDPDLTGSVVAAQVDREGRGFDFSTGYLQVSPDFRADLGFVRRRDIRSLESEAEYTWYPAKSRVQNFRLGVEGSGIWDFSGELEEWTIEPGFELQFAGQTEIGLRHWNIFERYEGYDFRRQSTAVYASTEWLSWLNLNGSADWGTAINYYPAEGLEPFLADSVEVEAGFTLKPFPPLRVDQSYLYSKLDTRHDEGGCLCTAGSGIFSNHILRTRASYQFTRELSVRFIVDYESVLPNQALVDLEEERRLGYDVLVTYLVNPWTALYVGYTDTYENWMLDAMSRPVARSDSANTNVGRQVFVKLSYLFRY